MQLRSSTFVRLVKMVKIDNLMLTALFMKWTPAAGPEIKILRNKEEKVILEVQKVILEP